jgi:hypothetical protein
VARDDAGEIFEVVLPTPHGGDLAGFTWCADQKRRLQRSEPTRTSNDSARAAGVVDRLGIVDAVLADGLGPAIATFQ